MKWIFILLVVILLISCTSEEQNFEKIAQEAFENEHEHDWVQLKFSDNHPHTIEYNCLCNATKTGPETQLFEMEITEKSNKHPHYYKTKCSICDYKEVNEDLVTELTFILDGYEYKHPHYGIVKCDQCTYSEVNMSITSENAGNTKVSAKTSETDHPHRLIFQCTYETCSYEERHDNVVSDYEMISDAMQLEASHPHFLLAACSYEGCTHNEHSNELADWFWEDGICSICGQGKDVVYTVTPEGIHIIGTKEAISEVIIPHQIEGQNVIMIQSESIKNLHVLMTLTIPNTVEVIESMAISDCHMLQMIIIEGKPTLFQDSFVNLHPECLIYVQAEFYEQMGLILPYEIKVIGEIN